MNGITVRIISRSRELPAMPDNDFFHSPGLFRIAEQSPGHTPFMVVCEDQGGRVVAHLLALVRTRGSLLPPYIFTQGRIYGEGDYDEDAEREDDIDHEQLFAIMLNALTRKLRRRLCFYIEFSDLSTKMFGYRYFRQLGYFPVSWQEVHNSLHSLSPEERLLPKMQRTLGKARQRGFSCHASTDSTEISEFCHILRKHFRLNSRRFIPKEKHFQLLKDDPHVKFFITTRKGKLCGGCACAFSDGKAFLWYLASRKGARSQHQSNALAIWTALQYAYRHNYGHMYFLDAGMPISHDAYRNFILGFGGKPVTKFRWFRTAFPWLNHLLQATIGG